MIARHSMWLAGLLVLALPSVAAADPSYNMFLPNGPVFGCATCHNNPCGGGCGENTCATLSYPESVHGDCLNVFGHDYRRSFGAHTAYAWDPAFRDHDSDGDGRTNGQELVYFGDVYPGSAVGLGRLTTNPGDATSFDTDECELDESADFGFPYHPRNYTNCALSAGAVCSDDDEVGALPGGSRYFGFSCACVSGFEGNGRVDLPDDGVDDSAATGCREVDECAGAGACTGENEDCVNLEGSFTCVCTGGHERGADGLPCVSVCGDGMIVGSEECDDGFLNSDTQRNACRSNCRAPFCGDGVVDGSETCDPGGEVPLAASDCDCPVDDAGTTPRDAGSTRRPRDAGAAGDGGIEPPSDPGGCGCSTSPASGSAAPLGLAVAVLALRRRRRRR